jgi:hypothetical protein
VPEFCTCGAQLPPDARFCHRCGKPQRDEPLIASEEPEAPAVAAPAPSAEGPRVDFRNAVAIRLSFIAALLANLFTVLMYLGSPLWMFASGMLSALWYGARSREPLSVKNGMRIGWMTGVFGFLVTAVFSTIGFALAVRSGMFEQMTREQIQNLPFAGGDVDAVMRILTSPAGMAINLLLTLLLMFIIFAAFSVMGGAAGARLSARRRAKASFE